MAEATEQGPGGLVHDSAGPGFSEPSNSAGHEGLRTISSNTDWLVTQLDPPPDAIPGHLSHS